jgi:hypothetical protein
MVRSVLRRLASWLARRRGRDLDKVVSADAREANLRYSEALNYWPGRPPDPGSPSGF